MAKGLRSKSKQRDKRIYRENVLKPNADRIANEMHERCLAAARAQEEAKQARIAEDEAAAAAAAAAPAPGANGKRPPVVAERFTGAARPRRAVVKYAKRVQNNPKKKYYNMHKHLVSKSSKRTGGPTKWTT